MHTCRVVASALLAVAVPSSAAVAAEAIAYQPPGGWVRDAPQLIEPTNAADAVLRVGYLDNQVRVAPDGTEEVYSASRLKILKPEGLPAGNVTVTWQPDSESVTVHHLRLIRDGHATDVLASTHFIILQREAQLEQSMLDGQRTANLQVPGLQVGDEIAFAITVRRRDPAFGGKVAGLMQMPTMGAPGAFRFRLTWPRDRTVIVRASKDLPPIVPAAEDGQTGIEIALRDPKGAIPTEGAPPRYNVRRLIEYSSFGTWADVARQMAPPFETAAALAAGSPIKVEAAVIAARTSDPVERAQAALQLVEDRIRYVFVAFNGGGYKPAGAEETWRRRFGDCKAKAVLLAALLRQLGIDAVPSLVNSRGGDGLDERLPSPRDFDHVIVRATIAGKVMWLDGTRLGDRHLDNLPSNFRWALPLRAAGGELERIAPRDNGFPAFTGLVDIDATAGIDHDARVSAQNILRGDEAFAIRTQLTGLTADDADRALKSYWRQQIDWLTPDKVSWSYDERRMAVTLGVNGDGNPGWKGDGKEGHSLTIVGAGFFPPDPLRRPKDQDQTAGWAVSFPRFRCWATTIRLPKAAGDFKWSLYADPMNRQLGGFTYWRASGFNGYMVRTVMSTHSYEPEAGPQEAEIVNRAIPNFNNNMSSISEVAADGAKARTSPLPFDNEVDWLNAPSPCSPGK